jgi:hypothetical protein
MTIRGWMAPGQDPITAHAVRSGRGCARPTERGYGTVALELSKVVYALVDHKEHRAGLGN